MYKPIYFTKHATFAGQLNTPGHDEHQWMPESRWHLVLIRMQESMANKSKAGSTYARIDMMESGTADEINGLCIKLCVFI